MPTVTPSTDQVTTRHERIMSLVVALVCDLPNQYPTLTQSQRRAVLGACAAFGEDLAAAGVRIRQEVEL